MHSRAASTRPCVGEPAARGEAVRDVDDAPLPEQPPVGAAVAGGAAVVDVHDGEAAAGPVLHAEAEHGRAAAVGPPWIITSSGGSSPAGPVTGLAGG